MQVSAPREPFDAIVVGSGATGGWAAKRLTEAGWRVALLEAGPKVTPKDYTEHVQPWQLPYLGQSPMLRKERPIQSLCYACRESNHKWFVNDLENPYTQEKPFHWIRMRVLGGRSLSWGRQSYRMSDLDFKAATHDGYGDDWPISYDDLVPYYELVEKYVGISGQGGESAAASGQRVSAADGNDLRRDDFARPVEVEDGTRGDDRTGGGADQGAQRSRGLPLLRSVRTGLHHDFVFFESADLPSRMR
jgi:choline dehydrogenase-like flavoprotein